MNSRTLSNLLLASTLSLGFSTVVIADSKPSHPDLSATTGHASKDPKTPGEANAKEVSTHRAGAGDKHGDAEISQKIKVALHADHALKDKNIAVEMNDGVATLSGTVSNDSEYKKAVAVAEKTEGVKQVKATGLSVNK